MSVSPSTRGNSLGGDAALATPGSAWEEHSAAIKNEARNGVSRNVARGWNCGIAKKGVCNGSSIDCSGASAATREFAPITAQSGPGDTGDAVRRELAVEAKANGCVAGPRKTYFCVFCRDRNMLRFCGHRDAA